MVHKLGVCLRAMEAQSGVTRETIAKLFALHTTDLKVLDLILLRGPASPGDIAQATGLSSGAVTALVDRLTAAGYVRRQADPRDRRRALVSVRHDQIEPIEALYLRLQTQAQQLWSEYSDDELAIVADFLTKSTALVSAYVRELAQKSSRPVRPRGRTRRFD